MAEYTKPAECKVRYWHSGGLIIQTKNQSDVRDAATILNHRESNGDEFAQELVRRWNSQPDLLTACEKAKTTLVECSKIFLGTRDEPPDPENMANAICDLDAAITKATNS